MSSFTHIRLLVLLAAVAIHGCSCGDDGPKKCMGPADCKEGELCAADGRCVPGAECVDDTACTAKDQRKECDTTTFTCVFRPGFADECSDTQPCAFGQFCTTLLGRCLDASMSRDCVRRGQCPSGQTCDRRANKCIPDLGCYGDDFCEDGELCDLVNHVCRAVTVECSTCFSTGTCTGSAMCTADSKECLNAGEMSKCRTGERCDPLGRCVQCLAAGDCGPGLFCNVALGKCESNVQCATDPSLCPDTPDVTCIMCTAPAVCDMRTRKCEAPATVCSTDVDCPGDQFCNLMIDPPVCQPRIPSCLNDVFEDTHDNNHFYDATPLPPAPDGRYPELKLCPGDADWYSLDVRAGTFLTIDARFRQDDGDIDLQLFLPDGLTLVDESRSSTDNERVELDAGTDRSLLLRVFLARPTINPVPYELVIARDMGDLCPDDANEPDDAISDAKPLTTDVPYEGRLCSADPDWFVLRNVQAKTHITATLEFTNNLGDLDLELYRAGGTAPILRSIGNTDQERIDYDASYGGDYFLRVFGKRADTNVYTLRADLRNGTGNACLDDQFEPNNVIGGATDASPILGTLITDLTLCAGDDDWYQLDLGPGEALTAEVGFDPGADIDLALYPGTTTDPRVTPLRDSTGLTTREYLAYRASVSGNYLVRVYGHDQRQISPYQLRMTRTPPFVTCPPDIGDQAMRGTSLMDAVDLPPAPSRTDDLTICNGDEDWYRVILQAGFTNVIRVEYLESDAQLDFGLFDASGQQLVQTGGAGTDTKEISVTVTGAGVAIAFIRVFRTTGFETAYSVTLDLIPIFNCFPDFTEPNDNPMQASLVASSTVSPIDLGGLTLCPSAPNPFTGGGDDDYYLITPPRAGARIDASIEFLSGDLFLELLNPEGTARACLNLGGEKCYSDTFDLREEVTYTATVARPYYLHVGSIYSSPNVQVRPPDADTPYTLHLDYTMP